MAWQRLLFPLIASKVLLQLEEKHAFQCCTHYVLLPRSFRQFRENEDVGDVITVYACIKEPGGTALRRALLLSQLVDFIRATELRGAGES